MITTGPKLGSSLAGSRLGREGRIADGAIVCSKGSGGSS